MGDFGGSGYRAEKIVRELFGIHSDSDEANQLKGKIQNEIIKHRLDYKTSDQEILDRVKEIRP
jgi:hypothetical protein